jgi:hypothetical protein
MGNFEIFFLKKILKIQYFFSQVKVVEVDAIRFWIFKKNIPEPSSMV